MRLLTIYLLLFAFCCYSIFSGQLVVMQNVADGELMECALGGEVDLLCCQANLSVTDNEHEESSEKSCCKDHCCCLKLVKSPFIAVENESILFSSTAIHYGEGVTFSYQQYTFNIFTPPQNIA